MGKKDKKRRKDKKRKAEKKALKAEKKAKKSARSLEPVEITTGKGPAPAEIGADLVAMFNRGQSREIEDKYWDSDIESIEGVGVSKAWRGRAAVEAKNAAWMSDHVIHGASAEGPYVGATGFAVKFRIDVETRSTGQRQTMEEIGVYTVRKGRIVHEEFMYSNAGSGAS